MCNMLNRASRKSARLLLWKWGFKLYLPHLNLSLVFPPKLPRFLQWAIRCNSYFRQCKVNTTPWGDFLIMNTKEVSALIKPSDDSELLSVLFIFPHTALAQFKLIKYQVDSKRDYQAGHTSQNWTSREYSITHWKQKSCLWNVTYVLV